MLLDQLWVGLFHLLGLLSVEHPLDQPRGVKQNDELLDETYHTAQFKPEYVDKFEAPRMVLDYRLQPSGSREEHP